MSHRSVWRDDLFDEKVAIVTGGATGIGLAIAEELAAAGARVVIASRKRGRLEVAARGLSRDLATEVVPIECNIRDRAQVDALLDRVLERFGKVDFLVNNGGGQFPAHAIDYSERGWNAVIDTNLNGTWNMCQAAAKKWMQANGGRIVNMAANMWRGFPGLMHTGAARAAVVNMTMSLAVEWAPHKILVNAVAPGTILSSGMNAYPAAILERSWQVIPMKRLGRVEDIAQAVAYLLSPAADFITGETLKIDGGGSLWNSDFPLPEASQSPDLEIPKWPEDRWPEFAPKDEE